MNAHSITARAMVKAVDATKMKPSRDELLWLVQRAHALRSAKGWSKAELERSWADWDKRARTAVKSAT